MITYKSKHCGQIEKPWSIITNMNSITVKFRSNFRYTRTGFIAVWTPTSEPPTYPPPPTGCSACVFPFEFGQTISTSSTVSCGGHLASDCSQCPFNGENWIGEAWCNGDCSWKEEACVLSTTIIQFDTCISIEGVDNQPWCSSEFAPPPPVDEGIHIFANLKINCSNGDSSCPNAPHQKLIASPEYPQYYPNNVNQVILRQNLYI